VSFVIFVVKKSLVIYHKEHKEHKEFLKPLTLVFLYGIGLCPVRRRKPVGYFIRFLVFNTVGDFVGAPLRGCPVWY
jgi:hypothetical protein